MLGQNKFTTKPVITNPAAMIFHRGNDSSKKYAAAPIPNIGTNKGAGATTAAGCLDSNQAQAEYPKMVFPQDCQKTPAHAPNGADLMAVLICSHPPSKMKEIANKGGMVNALAQTT